jgi:uncharacterized membrane protein YagU involved in acid resistance
MQQVCPKNKCLAGIISNSKKNRVAQNFPKSKLNAILLAGLVAGTLDISIALIQYYMQTGKDPANVLRYIASGVCGNKAFTGGNSMASIGLLLHYIIAFIWTIIFFLIYPKIPALKKNVAATAIGYGLLVGLLMNFIILPLSAVPPFHVELSKLIRAIVILIIAIGFPVSFFAKRYYARL